ncbi:MAG TPA: UDP-N-acetylmuramoyl-tripeptide--D-alanyl-D-alanine ligase [Acidobacteriaceae bacterium]|jgi:UDP-N-acetylmuramoyl-tripeptide--D-alanyl-D-alanine ligase|nr:UDP-N-acetylmuramoyl-tripeptide--D-alanyl-D-alanine ligase [Acidobacteriaceae bacterium]
MKLRLGDIARWTGADVRAWHGDRLEAPATGYSIDTRTLAPGDLFFAIRGERFDAHDFVPGAFENGARAAVIARSKAVQFLEIARNHTLLLVNDPLEALQHLASAVRRHWNKRLIGVTGSAGKTTTKEAVAAVLSARFQVLKSKGNLNNGFGLPLQLLKLEPEHDVAVIEMGMSHSGEIAALARIAAPDWAVVTNVGSAHQENFPDGLAGIARAKYELVRSLPAQGIAFLNCDDPYVSQFGRDFRGRAVYYGSGPCADPSAGQIEELGSEGMRFELTAGDRKTTVSIALLGRHNVSNVMAAIAVGLEAGIPLEECAQAAAQLRPPDKRGEILHISGAVVINDCYNSNPEALKSMIATLASMVAKRRILVAGEMLELGPHAANLHRECGREAAARGIDLVLGVRGNAQYIVEGAREGGVPAMFVASPEAAGEWLKGELRPGDAALLKASRGVGLERALKGIED